MKNKPQNLVFFLILLLLIGASLLGFAFFNSENNFKKIEIIKNEDGLFQTAHAKDFNVRWGTKEDISQIRIESNKGNLNLRLPLKQIEWKREGDKIQADYGPFTFSYNLIQSDNGRLLGVKEEIIVKQRTKGTVQFRFPILSNNLKLRKEEGLWSFYNQKKEKVFYIPKPFMVDSNGVRSEKVDIEFENSFLVIKPDQKWLQNAKYPVIIDPTFKLSIIDVHSHPQTGDTWSIEFETEGRGDLKIIPNDKNTIEDDEFKTLYCGNKKVTPNILKGDIIYVKDWECNEKGKVIHKTLKEGNHTLRFEFNGEVSFAYNSSVYDFTDTTDNSAFEKGGSLPTSPTDYTSEANSTDYTNLDSSDNNYWTTDLATTSSGYNSQIYNFNIDQAPINIKRVDVEWEGHGTSSNNKVYLKIYNYTSSNWVELSDVSFSSAEDQNLQGSVSGNISDYLSGSTISVMVVAEALGEVEENFTYSPTGTWGTKIDTTVRDYYSPTDSSVTVNKDIYCDDENCILLTDGATAPSGDVYVATSSGVYMGALWDKTDISNSSSYGEGGNTLSSLGLIEGTHVSGLEVGNNNTSAGNYDWLTHLFTTSSYDFPAMELCMAKGEGWRLPNIREIDSIRDSSNGIFAAASDLPNMKAESYISSTEQDGDFAAFFMAVFGGELTWESKTTGLANVRCIKTTEGVSDPTAPSELNTDYIKLEISPYPSIDIVNVNLSNIDLNVYEYTPPFCAKEADAKSTTTINGDILYCDSNLNMWTFTLSTTTYDWGCEGTTVGASSTSNGEYNTNQILYNGTTCSQRPIAASVCDTLSYAGYSDWFLPSEEASLTQNGGLVNDCTTDCGNRCACWDSNAQNARYWTSTELSSIAARAIDFTSFGNVMTNKSNNYVIRCVRN